jgi:AcrR family transcriptional regulator
VTTMQVPGRRDQQNAPVAKQKRSQITYNALIETGFRLLDGREFDSISIAEIAKDSGYSVGAFYARFANKEDFYLALVGKHIADRYPSIRAFFETVTADKLVTQYVRSAIKRIWTNRFFWRTALRRSMEDPDFWEPFRALSHLIADNFIQVKERDIGRKLTKDEEMNIRFALQMVLGTINNSITNRPGPIMLEHPDFQRRLVDAFERISGYGDIR